MIASFEDLLACAGAPVAIDIETTGLSWWSDEIIGIGYYSARRGLEGYIPCLDDDARAGVKAAVEIICEDPDTVFIGHNVSFEALFLDISPRRLPCTFLDSMIMAHLEDSRQRKGLEAVAARYLGIEETKRVYREAGRNRPIYEWPLELVSSYCVNDCKVEYQLAEHLMKLLKKEGLVKLLQKEMRYLGLLIETQRRGMLIDLEFINRAERVISANLRLMEIDLKAKVGHDFNWRSPQQLSKSIYDDLGIDRPVNPFLDEMGIDRNAGKSALFTKYNDTCTSAFLLMEKANHPLGGLVLDLRESDKLAKNYCQKWKELADLDNVIHGSFNITGTKTGRLSSSRPNMQNMPGEVRTRETQSVYSGGAIREDEYNLRQAFIARPGYSYLSIDYKQQEGRLFALISGDPIMKEFVRSKKDIHGEVAMSAWGVRDNVHREWAKTISFSILYGATAGSIQHRLNKTPEEAREIMNSYYARFPRILPFMNEVIRKCVQQGYIQNWAGRIWRMDRKDKAYKATNFLCQGGGADLLSIGGLRCQDWVDQNSDGHLVSFIHDELLFEIRDEALKETAEALTKIAEVEDLFDAPFLTEAKTGKSYGALKKVEKVAV